MNKKLYICFCNGPGVMNGLEEGQTPCMFHQNITDSGRKDQGTTCLAMTPKCLVNPKILNNNINFVYQAVEREFAC